MVRNLALLAVISALMIQCAPIGKPFEGRPGPVLGQQQENKKTDSEDSNAEEPKPFFNGTHKFENLKPYEIPKELVPYLPEELKPVDQNKPRLVIHNPVLSINVDKNEMVVTVELEVTGTDIKEKITLDGEFSKNKEDGSPSEVWEANIFPSDEKIASERRVQALASCLEPNHCINNVIRVWYRYKSETLVAQVESGNKRIVNFLEVHEKEEEHAHHDHSQPTQQEEQKKSEPQKPTEPQTEPRKKGNSSEPLEDTYGHIPSQETESSSPINSPTTEDEQNPSELDYLMKRIIKKILPEKKADEEKKEEPAQPKQLSPIEPIQIDPSKAPAPSVPPKQEEQKKIEPLAINKKPAPTTEDMIKRDKTLTITLPTPLPAPKTDDRRSIPGLKDIIQIPGNDEDCTKSKPRPCQSHGRHDSGFLRAPTLFPTGLREIIKQVKPANYNPYWGNQNLVDALIKSASEVNEKYPSARPFEILQISSQSGGRSRVSQSHQNGLDADIIWPGNTLGDMARQKENNNMTQLKTKEYDRTFDFMKSLVCAERSHIGLILVDQSIKVNLCRYAKAKYPEQVKNPNSCEYKTLYALMHWNGHHDHMHIRSACPRYSRCAPDDKRPQCIHAYCKDEFVVPNKGHNIGC